METIFEVMRALLARSEALSHDARTDAYAAIQASEDEHVNLGEAVRKLSDRIAELESHAGISSVPVDSAEPVSLEKPAA